MTEKLTPPKEEYFEDIGFFPADWWDDTWDGDGLKLKDEAPERAKKMLAEWQQEYDEAAEKGLMID